MGHLRRAPSGNWRAAYRTPEGKERTCTFKTKREARAFLAQVEGDKSRGLCMDPAGAQLRFCELADRWWAARDVELTTAAANRSRLDSHMLPMWGEWPIGRIEHLDVQAWVKRLSRRLRRRWRPAMGCCRRSWPRRCAAESSARTPAVACAYRLAAGRLMPG